MDIKIIKALSFAEFRTRYVSSFRGFMWSFIRPIFYFLLYYIIFLRLLGGDAGNYAVFLFSGIIVWTFLSEIASRSNLLFKINSSIIQQFKFEKSNLIFSTILTSLITFAGMTIILVPALFYFGKVSGLHFLILALSIFATVIFAIELSIFCSITSLYFEDFPNIWELISMTLFWVSPIVYSASKIKGIYAVIIKLNQLVIFRTWKSYIVEVIGLKI